MVQAKQGADLHTATFNQMVAYEVGHGGFFDKHIRNVCQVYRERRDVMLEALEEHMPAGVRWTTPKAACSCGLELPDQLKSADVLKKAVERKVAFVPGSPFFPNGGGENTMRLNFSNATPEKINEGIARLGMVIKEQLN
jgi:2-aminoadipate transaminase